MGHLFHERGGFRRGEEGGFGGGEEGFAEGGEVAEIHKLPLIKYNRWEC